MRNVDWLYQHGKLLEFLYDYADMLSSDDKETCRKFEIKYGINPDKIGIPEFSIPDWLMIGHEEERKPAVGSKVRKSYMRSNGETFDIFGTVTQIVIDAKGEHVYVDWNDIDSFKTMETLGKDVFIAE